jgi:hypothetical protein
VTFHREEIIKMIQTYQGFFKNGQFMPLDISVAAIPDEIEVFITVTGRELQNIETTALISDDNKIEKRREMLKSITGVIKTDVDVKAMKDERISHRGQLE